MRIPRSLTATNVGREDRLVRACIALSLMLLGGFSMVGAPQVSIISITFLLLGLYFAVTAAFASDPGYGFAGIDTRTDIELAEQVQRAAREAAELEGADGSDPIEEDRDMPAPEPVGAAHSSNSNGFEPTDHDERVVDADPVGSTTPAAGRDASGPIPSAEVASGRRANAA